MLLYVFFLNFAVNLAGPFFTPYMLRTLHFSYPVYASMFVLSAVGAVWAVSHWGNAADRGGNRRMVFVSGLMVGVLPLWWAVSGNPLYLGMVNFLGGVAWAGFNLTTINYLYDATTPQNRATYLACFNIGIGIATALGALTGGLVISHLPPITGSAFVTLFLISGCLRILSTCGLMPHIKEARKVKELSASEVFHLLLGGGPSHRPHPHFRSARVLHAAHHSGKNQTDRNGHHVLDPSHTG
jgi:predicted MFS family arabinose efflux permease